MKVLVLGASSGIGREFVRALAGRHQVAAVSNDRDGLECLRDELAGQGRRIRICEADLTEKQQLISVCEKFRDVFLVINSAGTGRLGTVQTTDISLEEKNIRLNVLAFYYITKYFTGRMMERGGGSIINVCSSSSFTPMPGFSLYAATKAFAGSYTIAVSKECEKRGVYLMALCPGPTRTGFLTAEQFDRIVRLFPLKGAVMEPEAVVRHALRAYRRRQRIVIPGRLNRLIYYFDKLMPSGLVLDLIQRIYGTVLQTVGSQAKENNG